MKQKHKDNLLKLAAYLETLPDDYEQFHMFEYMKDDEGFVLWQPQTVQPGCGTVACAVGHGPSAGIRLYGDTNWDSYVDRVFGYLLHNGFEYMFGADWTYTDNTPKGAAARIRTYVELGRTPEGWDYEDAKTINTQETVK